MRTFTGRSRLGSLAGIVTIALLPLAGCASIIKGTEQSVSIRSNPTGAKVTIFDTVDEVEIASMTTPGLVQLDRGSGYFRGGHYKLTVTHPDHAPMEVMVDATFNGWYVGNLVFGGLLGLLVVDPLTGAMWSISPDSFTVDLAAREVVTEAERKKREAEKEESGEATSAEPPIPGT